MSNELAIVPLETGDDESAQLSKHQVRVQKGLAKLSAQALISEELVTEGFTYAGFCMVQLPHKRMPDNDIWVREFDGMSMSVEPGTSPFDRKRRIGVPFGARARMIMLYLQTQALRENSREVELGSNMNDWMRRMGIDGGGKDYRSLRDQMERISACKLTFARSVGDKTKFIQNPIIEAGEITEFLHNDEQGHLWNDRLLLAERFFEELKKSPVVVREESVRMLSSHSQALDVYIWLAHTLPTLKREIRHSWATLFSQFGGGYARARDWKKYFVANLQRALVVYELADITVDAKGIIAKPSPSPLETGRKFTLIK